MNSDASNRGLKMEKTLAIPHFVEASCRLSQSLLLSVANEIVRTIRGHFELTRCAHHLEVVERSVIHPL